jgi:hypothetical protein
MEKYKKLIGYHSLFLFPSDIDNDFKGVRDKLNIIDQNVDTKVI